MVDLPGTKLDVLITDDTRCNRYAKLSIRIGGTDGLTHFCSDIRMYLRDYVCSRNLGSIENYKGLMTLIFFKLMLKKYAFLPGLQKWYGTQFSFCNWVEVHSTLYQPLMKRTIFRFRDHDSLGRVYFDIFCTETNSFVCQGRCHPDGKLSVSLVSLPEFPCNFLIIILSTW